MDKRGSYRSQAGVKGHSLASSGAKREGGQVRKSPDSVERGRGPLKKRCHSQVLRRRKRGFVSPLFLVPKSDGSWRPVINLQDFNHYILAHHFKLESVRSVKTIIQKEDWLLKLDLKVTVPIHQEHQRYLRFHWQGKTWQFKVLPFGLSSAPYTFTKLLKPIVAILGSWELASYFISTTCC